MRLSFSWSRPIRFWQSFRKCWLTLHNHIVNRWSDDHLRLATHRWRCSATTGCSSHLEGIQIFPKFNVGCTNCYRLRGSSGTLRLGSTLAPPWFIDYIDNVVGAYGGTCPPKPDGAPPWSPLAATKFWMHLTQTSYSKVPLRACNAVNCLVLLLNM